MTTPVKNSNGRVDASETKAANSRNGGHAATFAAACRLVEFGLTFERARPLFESWNVTHCQPPWTEAELRHKLADAFKRTSPKTSLSALQSPSPFQERRSNRILARHFSPATAKTDKPGQPTPLDALAAKLCEGTEAELNALATLRGLLPRALCQNVRSSACRVHL
jgi:hypothetical protein